MTEEEKEAIKMLKLCSRSRWIFDEKRTETILNLIVQKEVQ